MAPEPAIYICAHVCAGHRQCLQSVRYVVNVGEPNVRSDGSNEGRTNERANEVIFSQTPITAIQHKVLGGNFTVRLLRFHMRSVCIFYVTVCDARLKFDIGLTFFDIANQMLSNAVLSMMFRFVFTILVHIPFRVSIRFQI